MTAKPDSDGGELDERAIVFGVRFETGGGGAEALDLVEEPPGKVALEVEERAGARGPLAHDLAL